MTWQQKVGLVLAFLIPAVVTFLVILAYVLFTP